MSNRTAERDEQGPSLRRFAYETGAALGAVIGLVACPYRMTGIDAFWWSQTQFPVVFVTLLLFETVLAGVLWGLGVAALCLWARGVVEGRRWLRWLLAVAVGAASGPTAGGYYVLLLFQRQSLPAAIITSIMATIAVSWGYTRVLKQVNARNTTPVTVNEATTA